jgi:hypothetical protein
MHPEMVSLHTLASRIRQADPAAAVGLCRQLEPMMNLAVAQAIRTGSESSPLQRMIQRELRRAGLLPGAPAESSLVRQISKRITAQMVWQEDGSTPACWTSADTVRLA